MQQFERLSWVILPAAYVLGMVHDFIAYFITYFPKQWVRTAVTDTNNDGRKLDKEIEMKVRTEIQMNYKELNTEINMRSSRDRIARGMIVNCICLFIFISDEMMPVVKLLFLITSVVSWIFFEYKSHAYFLSVYRQWDNKGLEK